MYNMLNFIFHSQLVRSFEHLEYLNRFQFEIASAVKFVNDIVRLL